jgi:hypothetical protein
MLSVRSLIGLLFFAALFFTAAKGWCADQSIDQQIAERTKQYQESLRQRAEQLSPSLRTKIESQAQTTVTKNTAAWKKGEVNLHVALPRLAEARRVAQFLARYSPFSGSPAGSLGFGSGIVPVALTVTTVQHVVKSVSISMVNSAIVHSLLLGLFRQDENVLSYGYL